MLPDGLTIAGVLPREDPQDAVVLPRRRPSDRAAAPTVSGRSTSCVARRSAQSPSIGTSSVRRIAQLTRLFPGARFAPIRGNLDTRLRKLDAGEHDALVLAAAGLRRLGFASRISLALPATPACRRPARESSRSRFATTTTRVRAQSVARSPTTRRRRRARRPSARWSSARRRLPDADRRAGVGRRRRRARARRRGRRARRQPRRPRPGARRRGATRRRSARASARSCSRDGADDILAERDSAASARRRDDVDASDERRTYEPERRTLNETTERMSIVYLIGAGPGDPGLITVRGLQCLAAADVVLYDHLVQPRLLRAARAGRRADRRRHRRAAAARAGSDLLPARREGARGQDRRAAEVGRSVRLRQRRRRSAVPARAGRAASKSCPAFRPASARAELRRHSDHLSRRRRHADVRPRPRGRRQDAARRSTGPASRGSTARSSATPDPQQLPQMLSALLAHGRPAGRSGGADLRRHAADAGDDRRHARARSPTRSTQADRSPAGDARRRPRRRRCASTCAGSTRGRCSASASW